MKDKRVHLIGIGGIGMSALALALIDIGAKVQGSDVAASYLTDMVIQHGATVFWGQKKEQIATADLIVYSTDIQPDNPEWIAALEAGLPMMHRSELLDLLQQGKKSLQIAGTHGKTTTTSLLAHALTMIDSDPCFAIGGVPFSLGRHGKMGASPYFVAESDESDGSHLRTRAHGAIITNLECEHMDYWKTKDRLTHAFWLFGEGVENENLLFWCYEDQNLRNLNLQGISYGFAPAADLQIHNFSQTSQGILFTVLFQGKTYQDIQIPLMGKHNALNTAAVFGMLLNLGFAAEHIKAALSTFRGVKRRLEFKGEQNEVAFWDDYAHHPTEITATLAGFRACLPATKRLVVIWQPHRLTRVKECWDLFPQSLYAADICIMTDIYTAREKDIEGINNQKLFAHLQKTIPQALYFPKETLLNQLDELLQKNDVVLTLGAGDITYLGSQFLERNKEKVLG